MRRLLGVLGLLLMTVCAAGLLSEDPVRAEDKVLLTAKNDYKTWKEATRVVVVRETKLRESADDGSGKDIRFGMLYYAPSGVGKDDQLVTIKNKNGEELVAVSRGDRQVLGYVAAKDVRVWKSRSVLRPIVDKPRKDADVKESLGKMFHVIVKENGKDKEIPLPPKFSGDEVYAYVISTQEEGTNPLYNVFVAAGPSASIQGEVRVKFDRKKVALEIVFVLESSDFFLKPFGTHKKLLDVMKELIKGLNQDLRQHMKNENIDDDILRLGVVQYWDNVGWKGPKDERNFNPRVPNEDKAKLKDATDKGWFPAKVTLKLDKNTSKFDKTIEDLEVVTLWDDWPDDVLGGLFKAIGSEAGWQEDSIKHVVLIGSSAFQLQEKRAKAAEPDRKRLYDRSRLPGEDFPVVRGEYIAKLRKQDFDKRGVVAAIGNTNTKFTIERLLTEAYSSAETGPSPFKPRTIHAVLLPNEKPPLDNSLAPAEWKRLEYLCEDLLSSETEKEYDEVWKEVVNGGYKEKQLNQMMRYMLVSHQHARARGDYERVTKPQGERGGQFTVIEWTEQQKDLDAKLNSTIQQLAFQIKESLELAQKTRRDEVIERPSDDNPHARGWYDLYIQTSRNPFYSEVQVVQARPRHSKTRETTAKEAVFITRDELVVVNSTLVEMDKQYKAMYKNGKIDLQELVAKTHQILATTFTAGTFLGQKAIEEQSIKELLRIVPFRTKALNTELKQIAAKNPEEKDEWFRQLEEASKDISKLVEKYDKEAKWMQLGGVRKDGKAASDEDLFAYIPIALFP